jgi:GNAT superfamily N-acetyltransferase
MPQRTFTVAQRPELADRLGEVGDPWPEFLRHDEVVNSGWDEMYSRWPELQVVPLDEETDEILGKGNAKPVEWDGRVDMSSGGVVEVLEPEFQEPNALGAIVAVIEPVHQGRGLSGLVIRAMAEAAAAAGLECLIAPVRADLARALPLTRLSGICIGDVTTACPLTRGSGFTTAWVPRSCLSLRDPSTFAGLSPIGRNGLGCRSPRAGRMSSKGALVPVTIDRERDEGRYVEPNVWMRHAAR